MAPAIDDAEKYLATGERPDEIYGFTTTPRRQGGIRGFMGRSMDLLVKHGVEERGIQPRPEDERERLSVWSYLPQFTLWAAWNTNILTFSEGALGPAVFALDFRTTVICIVLFTAFCCIPPAYLATNGPKTGMRQLVQGRYAFGYYPGMVFGIFNCASFLGFLSLTVILGGQCLSLASGGDMSWTVGIVVVAVIALLLSFVGLRALHVLSLTSFPICLILFTVLVAINGSNLKFAVADAVAEVSESSAGAILGYGSTLIGFTVSYVALASDFSTNLPAHTPRWKLFTVVYLGLFIPIILIQILGAAAQTAAISIDAWAEAAVIGTPNLLFAMTGAGKAARFVMVLFCFSVVANTAPTIYSCGLSAQVAIPWLVRIPRYFLAIVVTAVLLPIAIAGSNHFYTALNYFASCLGYWTAIYMTPVVLEPLIFRRPVGKATYPVEHWDQPSKLPMGIAAVAVAIVGIPVIAASMAQTWWVGWIARRIDGEGDIAFELTFVVAALVYVPVRYLERRYTGR